MFGVLKSLAKAGLAVVAVPVAIAKDAFEIGSRNPVEDSNTKAALKDFAENIKDAASPEKEEK